MAATSGSDVNSSDVLRSERIAGGILPKVLNSFDMVAIFVAIVLFVSNSAGVAAGAGPAAYSYWILGFLTFLIPGAIVTGQLGLMFPGEGSIYVWTNKAFGPFMGFFAGFCAWWPGVLVMIATGDAVVSLIQQFNSSWLGDPWQQGLVIILVIAFSFFISILRFRVTQNFVNVVFVAYGGAILLIGVAGLLAFFGGHAAHVDYAPHRWVPSVATYTFYGTVILALLGVEVPLNMGVEDYKYALDYALSALGCRRCHRGIPHCDLWSNGGSSYKRSGQSLRDFRGGPGWFWCRGSIPRPSRQLHFHWLFPF